MTSERIAILARNREVLVAYLKAKIEVEDWHGVSDAANDIREIDAELKVLRESTIVGWDIGSGDSDCIVYGHKDAVGRLVVDRIVTNGAPRD